MDIDFVDMAQSANIDEFCTWTKEAMPLPGTPTSFDISNDAHGPKFFDPASHELETGLHSEAEDLLIDDADILQPAHYAPDSNPDDEPNSELPKPKLAHLRVTLEFIKELKAATRDNSTIPQHIYKAIANPVQDTFNIENHDHQLSLDIYLGIQNAS